MVTSDIFKHKTLLPLWCSTWKTVKPHNSIETANLDANFNSTLVQTHDMPLTPNSQAIRPPPLEVKCCHACHRRPGCRTIEAELQGWCVNYDTIYVSHNPYIRASKLHSHFQFTPQCPERSGPDLSPTCIWNYHLAEIDRWLHYSSTSKHYIES